jgi:hypothetical protein
MPYYRSDQFSIGVKVEGLAEGKQTDNIPWDSLEGFDQTVEGQTYLPGGMRPQTALGGIPKRSPGTLKRIWSTELLGIFKALDQGAGQLPCTVTVTTLGANRKAVENAPVITYTGVLGTVTRPNYGSETPEKAYLQIMIDADGELG